VTHDPVEVVQLDNGFRALLAPRRSLPLVASVLWYRVGSRDERTGETGLSHFLEHMMFKGSERRTAFQVNEDFDRIGASHNAFTTGELTAFHAHVLPENLGEAVGMLADILRPALRSADFDEEKGVILEEIAMYEDNPFMALYERMMERYYDGHPMGHRVLGTKESISALQRDALAGYFHERYASDTMALAVAGKVDFDALVAQASRVCGAWPRGMPGRSHTTFRPNEDRFEMRLPNLTRAYFGMMMPAPPLADPRRYASSLVAQIVGDAEGSRFYWSLVETGLAEEATCSFEGRDGVGEYLVVAACERDAMSEVKAKLMQEMTDLSASLEQPELDRAKARIATAVALAGERPAGRMTRLGSLWAYGMPHTALEQEMQRIEATTLEDLQSCLREFPLQPVVTGQMTSA